MPTTATPYKEFFPFDDYAKKGIVQVRLEDENHDAITGIMPESIKYGINNGVSNEEFVFNTDLREQFNFRELGGGVYRFDVYCNPYKKSYRLTGTNNADDTNCQTTFHWYSGLGYKTEYRTDEMSVMLQNDTPDTIYYKLSCRTFGSNPEEVSNDSSNSGESYSESSYLEESSSFSGEYETQSNRQYQWLVSRVNLTENDETIVYLSEASVYYKDSIPTKLVKYGINLSGVSNDKKEDCIVFLTPRINAESSTFDLPITISANGTNFAFNATFSPERVFFDSEIRDFDFIPEYSPIKSQSHTKKLEFLNVNTDDNKKSFISKVIPAFYVDSGEKIPIQSFVEYDEESSSSGMEDKSNTTEFVSKISLCSYTLKTGVELPNLTAKELFTNFEVGIPYTNYFLEIVDVNGDGNKYVISIYQAISTKAGYNANLIEEPGRYYAKGGLIKSIEIENNNFDGERRDTVIIETIKINGEVYSNSRRILNFSFDIPTK